VAPEQGEEAQGFPDSVLLASLTLQPRAEKEKGAQGGALGHIGHNQMDQPGQVPPILGLLG
jgi:hypothetical protein